MSDWQKWNDMSDTQRLVSWREACDQLAEARAEVERLTGILQRHNDACDESCEQRDKERCEWYTKRGRTCVDCPKDDKIEFRLPDPTAGSRDE